MNAKLIMESGTSGIMNDNETGFSVRFGEIIFKNVPDDYEIVIDDRKCRLILIDVCKNTEKLINEEWPSVINLNN